ncbi:MAG: hypothetical protein FD121_589 [Gallionellaceae bacterium]|nr:MAG: hypothetical protein FD121_589 [Gallionellaceae bacterium]
MPHLLVDITAHGYGHIAQTAPVVNELVRRIPDLRVTVRSAATTSYLQQRFTIPFQHIHTALDFGMTMFDAVAVDVPRSLANYREYHTDWEAKVVQAAQEMRALQPDLLFANVPYKSLAAAQFAGIPSVAMCCLNWADIYRHYAPDDAESRAIHAQMLAAYNSAEVFLKVSPTMPMDSLSRVTTIAPIAQLGVAQRDLALSRCGGQPSKLVLVAMGGIDYRLPMEKWPRISGVRWLVPQAWNIQRDDTSALETMGMSFSDLLTSCDVVLTKPGYGTFAEAAYAGVPIIYVSRGEWPEQPYLVDWLGKHGTCVEVVQEILEQGNMQSVLDEACSTRRDPAKVGSGVHEAAEILHSLMMRTRL